VVESGRTRSKASSGQPTNSSSALGIRSGVANLPRASATIVRQPSCPGRAAERLRCVDRADHEQAQWRLEDVREDPAALVLQHTASPRPEQIVDLGCKPRRGIRFFALDREPSVSDALAFDDGEQHRAPVVFDHLPQPVRQLLVGFLDEDVDLAAAGQSDLERKVVRDPYVSSRGPAPPSTSCATP